MAVTFCGQKLRSAAGAQQAHDLLGAVQDRPGDGIRTVRAICQYRVDYFSRWPVLCFYRGIRFLPFGPQMFLSN